MRTLMRALVVSVTAGALACGGGEPGEAGPEADTTAAAMDTSAAAPTPEMPAREPAAEASGQAVFNANCATCHGEGGRGQGPAAVGLEPPPANLTDSQWVTGDGSMEAIVNTIENGSPGTAMIAWKGTLTEAQIDAVARYVQSLGGR